jgi:hypothetical protein
VRVAAHGRLTRLAGRSNEMGAVDGRIVVAVRSSSRVVVAFVAYFRRREWTSVVSLVASLFEGKVASSDWKHI